MGGRGEIGWGGGAVTLFEIISLKRLNVLICPATDGLKTNQTGSYIIHLGKPQK